MRIFSLSSKDRFLGERMGMAVFLLGALIFFGGLADYFSTESSTSSRLFHTSLTTRDLAMSEAIKNGQKEYSFTTNFIPGLGVINDPAAYKKDWETQTKELLKIPGKE